MKKTPMILGLDIGPNSLGWALLEFLEKGKGGASVPHRLVDAGVRVFPEGVDRTQQGTEQSKSAARREARSARRIHQRRNRRRGILKEILTKARILPKKEDEFSDLMSKNPYELRARGLDKKLSLTELGRVLYHLAQRRGFKSNRKSEKDKEDGKVKTGISELQAKIDAEACSTLGEYLHKFRAKNTEDRLRGHYTHRNMYENEFGKLWEKQSAYYPGILTEKLRENAYGAIFFQRPFDIRERWGKNLERLPKGANAWRAPEVGACEYEKDEKRSPRATWYAQRFRLLQDVNNIRIIDTKSGELLNLTKEQRVKVIECLGSSEAKPFDELRKLLGLGEHFKFNLEEAGRKGLKGNQTEWNLRVSFKKGGKDYAGLSVDARDEIIASLIEEEDPEALRKKAVEVWGLTEEGAERLLKSKLEGGYLNLSVKAIKRLLPHLEAGKNYMEAVEAAGYERRDQRKVETAAALSINDVPAHTNPLVAAALYQTRKVVNAVIREYGIPEKIRVELVRGLKSSKEKRKQMIGDQRDNEKKNADAKERLQEGDFGTDRPSAEEVLKYKLWEECRHTCPYTGRTIPKEALLTSDVEIEHIIPYSRSLNDSYMNKTLCFTGENRLKKDRTPFEFYGHDEELWGQILKRIKGFPDGKRDKFYLKGEKLEEHLADFNNRQLNDTAYIAREARAMLEKAAGKNNVQIGAGGVTAALRNLWGLNSVLGGKGTKNREDHRHHTVDAVCVALTTAEVIKRLSAAAEHGRRLRKEDFPEPWKNFREDVKKRIDSIVVSHRVRRKVSGPLHEETNYGILDRKDEKGQPLYAVRKALSALTQSEVMEKIGDKKVKAVIIAHLKKHGVDIDKKVAEKTSEWKKAMHPDTPPHLPNKNGQPVPIKRVRLHKPMGKAIHLGYRAVDPGNNHHIVIFEYTDGPKKGRWDGDVVTLFEAAQRLKDEKPVIRRDLDDGKKFVMSLSIGEMIKIGKDADARYWRVQKMDAASNNITFRLHTASTIDNNEERLFKYPNGLKELGAAKVVVDPIGRIRDAND